MTAAPAVPEDIPLQARIEAAMDTYREGDRWEAAVLFSAEGLPMASQGASEAYGDSDLLQFAFALIGAVNLLGGGSGVREVWLDGRDKRVLSFHYFTAWGEALVLAAVAGRRRGYRRAVARLISYIQSLG
jgi:hypothetical protein